MAHDKSIKKLDYIYKVLNGDETDKEKAKKYAKEVASDLDGFQAITMGRDRGCDPGETIPE